MTPQQDHPEEHQKIIAAHEKAAHYFEHAVKNHRAAADHLKQGGNHEKAAHHGYTAYGFAVHAQKHAEEAALHHSHEHGDKEPLHAHEQGSK